MAAGGRPQFGFPRLFLGKELRIVICPDDTPSQHSVGGWSVGLGDFVSRDFTKPSFWRVGKFVEWRCYDSNGFSIYVASIQLRTLGK